MSRLWAVAASLIVTMVDCARAAAFTIRGAEWSIDVHMETEFFHTGDAERGKQ